MVKKLLAGIAIGVDRFLKALDVVGLTWLTQLQCQGQYRWIGRPGWWYLFLRRETGGSVPNIGASHASLGDLFRGTGEEGPLNSPHVFCGSGQGD